jgi:hypothetical protein
MPGFDAKNIRSKSLQLEIITNIARNKRNSYTDNDHYFDKEIYKNYNIEITNTWFYNLRSILNRFATTVTSTIVSNYLVFIVITSRKFQKRNL